MPESDITRQVRTFADELVGQVGDIYRRTRPYRPTGHPSHDDRPRSPKQMLGDIAWSYCGIIDADDVPPSKKVTVCVGDLDAALHAAFHAGRNYAEVNR